MEQNNKNHKRLLPGFHGLTFILLLTLFISSIHSLYRSFTEHYDLRFSVMFFIISILMFLMFYYVRSFPLKAQDRAIRAEENLRYFKLTGKLFDDKLKMSQIIALRFASDNELTGLTEKAIKENLSNSEIKKQITNWRADFERV